MVTTKGLSYVQWGWQQVIFLDFSDPSTSAWLFEVVVLHPWRISMHSCAIILLQRDLASFFVWSTSILHNHHVSIYHFKELYSVPSMLYVTGKEQEANWSKSWENHKNNETRFGFKGGKDQTKGVEFLARGLDTGGFWCRCSSCFKSLKFYQQYQAGCLTVLNNQP